MFHYNSDMSGNVLITNVYNEKYQFVEISGSDILEFVAEFIRSKKISQLEQMNTKEILKL